MSDITKDSVNLSWGRSTDEDGKVMKYFISYKVKGGSFGSPITTNELIKNNNQGYNLNTTYIFKLQAQDDKGGLSEELMSEEVTTKAGIAKLSFDINVSKTPIVQGEEVTLQAINVKGKAPFSL